jgi:carbonic anhydrase/acetyltransferase-like protein (isoleucine patch superfamily)
MNDLNLKPDIDKSVYVAAGAQVVGNVRLCAQSSVWYNAVIRGDIAPITVGEGSNVQDNCTLHCDAGVPLVIGKNVSIGHNAVLHSCTVDDGSLIGMGSIVLSGAAVGKGCIIAAGSVVTARTVVPDGTLFMGVPAKFKRNLSKDEQEKLLDNAATYKSLVAQYKKQT